MSFTNHITVLHKISGYNERDLPVLKRIAQFKYGDPKAKTLIGGELRSAVMHSEVDFPNTTMIMPLSKSPLPRPIVDVGTGIALWLGMKVLSEDDVTKYKPARTIPYGDITDPEMRAAYGSFIKINPGSICTPFVMILDDTWITGSTVDKYTKAIRDDHSEVERIQSLAYAQYPYTQLIAESITNHLPVWNIKEASALIAQTGLTTTSSKILLNLSSRVFLFLLQHLPSETKQKISDDWKYYRSHNLFSQKIRFLDGKKTFSDKVKFSYYKGQSRQLSQFGSVLLFPTEETFMSWAQYAYPLNLQNSDFVVYHTRDGFKVKRFFSFSNCWVSQLEVYPSLASLREDVLGC